MNSKLQKANIFDRRTTEILETIVLICSMHIRKRLETDFIKVDRLMNKVSNKMSQYKKMSPKDSFLINWIWVSCAGITITLGATQEIISSIIDVINYHPISDSFIFMRDRTSS